MNRATAWPNGLIHERCTRMLQPLGRGANANVSLQAYGNVYENRATVQFEQQGAQPTLTDRHPEFRQ